jgi:hypothetical protein
MLIVGLAVIGITIISIHTLLWIHLFVGLVLIGPLALKLASTGYRFARYYSGDARYLEHGPPELALRLIAPLVIASTLVVFISGVFLLFVGPSARATWFPIHKDSFFVWIALMAAHVLGHLPAVARGLRAEYGAPFERAEYGAPGRSGRAISLASALALGIVLALVLAPEFTPWMHARLLHHH